MNLLREKEVMLHQYEIRKDIEQLKSLLHPNLIEIGYSGKTFDFDSTIADLPNEEQPDYSVWSQDYEYIELATDLVQLIYKAARLNKDGTLSRFAKRTSIWQNNNGQWQMRFHQGTPTDAFEKSAYE